MARGHERAPVQLSKLLHHWKARKNLREVVAVRHARRRLGVVLHEADLIREEAVEARRRRRRAAAGIGHRQLLLQRLELELGTKVRVLEDGPFEARQRGVDAVGSRDRLISALAGEELRSQRHGKGPLAEHQLSLALTFGERLSACLRQPPVFEQTVVGGDRVFHASTGLTDGCFCRWFHQRCSPRHGGVASPRA